MQLKWRIVENLIKIYYIGNIIVKYFDKTFYYNIFELSLCLLKAIVFGKTFYHVLSLMRSILVILSCLERKKYIPS